MIIFFCSPRLSFPLASALLMAMWGCGPGGLQLVPVQGRVTLDGQPLKDATVQFRSAQGRPSVGRTDVDGRYSLSYTAERAGAIPGEHTVSITTVSEDSEGAPAKETIPARYNRKTELKAQVGSAAADVDFELQSK